jgi:two-component system, OmpR family, KDP operon response regulator KdpE
MSQQIYDQPYADPYQPVQLELVNHKPTSKRGNKILVIEDDAFLCMGLKARLKANHYDVCFAHDAESALSAALTETPDLIILDIGLPRRDGYFVMQSLNALPELAEIPIIVLTARAGLTDERRCLDAGAKRFFEKPVRNRHLLTAIRQLMG